MDLNLNNSIIKPVVMDTPWKLSFQDTSPLAHRAPIMGRHKERDLGRYCEMVAMASIASLLKELFLWVRAMESSDQPTHGV